MSTNKTNPNSVMRGLRTPLPPGTVLGRLGGGHGPAYPIDLNALGQHLARTGQVVAPGRVSNLKLSQLTDVALSSPSTNQILKYNGSAWVNSLYALSALTDVDTTGLITNMVLRFNGTKWVPHTMIVSDLGDVSLSGLADGQALVWHAATSQWINGAGSGGSATLAGDTDVSIVTPADKQALVYVSAATKWENIALTLNGGYISDAVIASPAAGDMLRYDGTHWVNYTERKWAWPGGQFSGTTNATAAACKGNFTIFQKSIIVDRMYVVVSATSGHVYGGFIANITGTGNAATIASAAAIATRVTAGSTAIQTLEFVFSSPVTLTAGQTYGFCCVDTSVTASTALSIVAGTSSNYPSLPIDIGLTIKTWNISGSGVQAASWVTNTDNPVSQAVNAVGVVTFPIGLRWYDA